MSAGAGVLGSQHEGAGALAPDGAWMLFDASGAACDCCGVGVDNPGCSSGTSIGFVTHFESVPTHALVTPVITNGNFTGGGVNVNRWDSISLAPFTCTADNEFLLPGVSTRRIGYVGWRDSNFTPPRNFQYSHSRTAPITEARARFKAAFTWDTSNLSEFRQLVAYGTGFPSQLGDGSGFITVRQLLNSGIKQTKVTPVYNASGGQVSVTLPGWVDVEYESVAQVVGSEGYKRFFIVNGTTYDLGFFRPTGEPGSIYPVSSLCGVWGAGASAVWDFNPSIDNSASVQISEMSVSFNGIETPL